jgi:hypothetical protein
MKLILVIMLILKFSLGIWILRHRIHRIIVEGRKTQQPMIIPYELFLYYRASVGL